MGKKIKYLVYFGIITCVAAVSRLVEESPSHQQTNSFLFNQTLTNKYMNFDQIFILLLLFSVETVQI